MLGRGLKAMFYSIKLLATISRSEFLLPNLGSLIMGLAWGASPPLGLIDGAILIVLSFSIINISSAIGAQANTLSDYELDLKDGRKKKWAAQIRIDKKRIHLVDFYNEKDAIKAYNIGLKIHNKGEVVTREKVQKEMTIIF